MAQAEMQGPASNGRLQHPNKRIVVCLDGTWNEPEEASEKLEEKTVPTNVLKTVRGISPLDRSDRNNPIVQTMYYDEGVGTDAGLWDKYVGGGLGYGLSNNIRQAYRFIANNYEPGDHIFLFGFSRGAYTARSLAGFIGFMGLLEKRQLHMLPEAYKVYRTRPEERAESPFWAAVDDLRHNRSRRPVPIEFIGVWDTVGALGAPTPMLNMLSRKLNIVGFHNTTLGEDVTHAYHALAVDERRRPFQPDLWDSKANPDSHVEQVWFAGVHSNVGGGYENTVLSNITLRWMIDRAMDHGLTLEPHLADFEPRPISEGRVVDSFTWGYHALRLARVPPYAREIGPREHGDIRKKGQQAVGESIHPTVAEAVRNRYPIDYQSAKGQPYEPQNLLAALDSGLPIWKPTRSP